MKFKALPGMRWTILPLVTALLACSLPAHAEERGDVVYRLYRDTAWELVFDSDKETRRHTGKSMIEQSQAVLERYFAPALVKLLLDDRKCMAAHGGDQCNLDFDPIYNSQDPQPENLTIVDDGKMVRAQYKYVGSKEANEIDYVLVKTAHGWRIGDMIYPNNNNASLKALLSRKVK